VIKVVRSAVIDAPIERVWAILRDFNSHTAWHPVVAESEIENGEPSDQVGCVRSFRLHDGHTIREQLLALSDRDHVSSYCILEASLPLRQYVATVQLKRVTDGDRTFWHWQSTFDTPRGREQEFTDLVGRGVYEGGFEGLRTHLRRSPRAVAGRAPVSTASLAGHAVLVTRHGGPDVLRYQPVSAAPPGPGEVRVRHTAMLQPPAPLGMEAAGVVVDVGPGVAHLLPGDRVAYACPPPGAYASVRTLPAEQVVVLPDDVDDEAAAALMLKGLTAEYLLHRTHAVRPGTVVLVHAAAGGVGSLLCQWAKALGARVLGTVSTDEKARAARTLGCDVAIVAPDTSFAAAVKDATGGRGADVIYDGLGQAAVADNLEALALCGHWVSYGQATGPIEPLPPERLSEKSVTLSRPVLFHYTARREVLIEMAERTFEALRRGIIRPDVRHRYPLAAADDAHRDLEGRRTTGQVVLVP
jgi:NADPH:quinone reductase-like Zn-dependent oxidoreductase